MTAVALETPTIVDENAGIPPALLDLMGRIDMEPVFKSERGLLYSFRGELPVATLEGHEPTIKVLEYEVLVKPETVTLREITYTSGVNFKAKKVFRSWKTDRSLSLSLKTEKHGHRVLRIYEHLTRTKKYRGSFTNATARQLSAFELNSQEAQLSDLFRLEDLAREFQRLVTVPNTDRYNAYQFAKWALYQIMKQLDPTNPALTARSFAGVAAYPAFHLFPNSFFNVPAIRECVGKSYNLHAEPDVKKFIAKVFGPEGVRKDMVKAVLATTDINSIFLASKLKELYPLDWLRDFVRTPTEFVIFDNLTTYRDQEVEGLVALLSTLTLPQRKRLLVEKFRAGHALNARMHLQDSIRMFSLLTPENKDAYANRLDYSSWNRLHETLMEVSREISDKEKSVSDYHKIEWDKTYMAKLHDTFYEVEGEKYHIFAPKSRGDLRRWGNEMHNCIGGYYREVSDHQTNVFAVHHKNVLFANVEINNRGEIIQHMQKYNNPAPQEHFDALTEHIRVTNEKIQKRIDEGKRIQEAMKRRRVVAA